MRVFNYFCCVEKNYFKRGFGSLGIKLIRDFIPQDGVYYLEQWELVEPRFFPINDPW